MFMPELFSAAMRVTAAGGEAGDAPERALVRGPEKVECWMKALQRRASPERARYVTK